jgi:hypothetical protein
MEKRSQSKAFRYRGQVESEKMVCYPKVQTCSSDASFTRSAPNASPVPLSFASLFA